MNKIAVTNIAALCGLHKFKTQAEALNDLNKSPVRYVSKILGVETELRRTTFFRWYVNSRVITGKMRIKARSLINRTCKRHQITYGKPWSFFAKCRGITMEKFNTNLCETLIKEKIVNRQKKISMENENYKILGAIDGETESFVIEIKSRSSPIQWIPEWEQIQLAFYCHMLRKPGKLYAFHNKAHILFELSLEEADTRVSECLKILDTILPPRSPLGSTLRSTRHGLADTRLTEPISSKAETQNTNCSDTS